MLTNIIQPPSTKSWLHLYKQVYLRFIKSGDIISGDILSCRVKFEDCDLNRWKFEKFGFLKIFSWNSETLYNNCNERKAFDHRNCNTLPHGAVENDGWSPEKQPTVKREWSIQHDLTTTLSFIPSWNYSFRVTLFCLLCRWRFTVNECLDLRSPLAAILSRNSET